MRLLRKLLTTLLCVGFISQLMAQQNAFPEFRKLETDNLVYLYLDNGLVILEMAPFMAPAHVQRFQSLVAEGFYDGLDLYRVIDGFVAQGGDVAGSKESEFKSTLNAEFSRALTANSSFDLLQTPEFLAEQTGFINGFPAGRNTQDKAEWLVHCPGMLAMARSNDANSATTDFYIVIGQAPRHLDRNMSVFGQVVHGMQHVQMALRGDRNVGGGVIEDANARTKIVKARLARDVAASERLNLRMQDTNSEAFENRVHSARTLNSPFFHYKGTGNLDVCYYRPTVSMIATDLPTETSNQ